MRLRIVIAMIAAMPVVVVANGAGPPPLRTGAAVDGGTNCTACHGRSADLTNADQSGKLEVILDALSYRPGQTNTIRVRVSHPDQQRWGFQLTAREAKDLTKQAGVFTATTDIRVRCANGTDGPCDGGLEFASHRLAPRTAVGAGFTFDVTWTAPAIDLGDVVFYIAGNAANGDGTNGGAIESDHIYTTVRTLSAPCSLTAKPTITGVADAASYRAAWAPNGLLSLFGNNFASAAGRRDVSAFDTALGFPKELGCVAVDMGGVRVPVTHVSANQINIQALTTGLNSGAVPITVVLNPGRPNELKSEVSSNTGLARLAPALFTSDGTKIVAQVGGMNTLISDARPVRPGELITLYGTGMGYTNPVWQAGEIPTRVSPLLNPATISIGGVSVASSDITYAGLAVGSVSGLYQINVRVPATVTNGSATVIVTVGGVATQSGITIPVQR